ncbi:MAG: hypothetical protein Q8K12_13590 [Thiobacillus sp.]|nr:hypothetical protein [Thiobacillus sp.]
MSVNLFTRIITGLKSLKRHPAADRFIQHSKRVFARKPGRQENGPIVLFELNAMHSAHIAYSYLANVLATENDAQIKAYVPRAHANQWEKFSFQIRKFLGLEALGIYKSFGTTDFITIEISDSQREKARRLFAEVVEQLDGKWDIEALTIHGVWVGDLIYDTYLMRFKKPTIDKTSPEFQRFLLESIELFIFWEDYLNSHDVRAINVSHCVYNLAMPLRLAVERNIPVFQANATHIYRMSKSNYFAYNDFFYFRERFAALPENVKTVGIAEAQSRIERRFAGEVGVDMAYSTKSAYGASRHPRLLRESPRKKILIATHCFFDSPHSYGNNIFPDFYEWLDFIGKMTEVTDYDWYIKTHPDYLPGTMEIVEGFIAKYPKFTLLPSDASHHQLIAEGIDVALTVYGTIAFEYAALGVPVINNSLNNPHIAYSFNLHSKDVEDYRRLLLGLDTLDFKIDKQQVYEYYFMRHMYNTEDLFFNSYDTTIKELGGYSAQFTDAVYGKWLDEWTPDKHQSIISALQAYIRSGDFRMDYGHYGREFTVESIGAKS